MNKRIITSCVACALGAWATGAAASGFQLMEQNASGLGNAYAGQAAAAENASTIFFNPAGMTYLTGPQVSFAVSAIKPSSKFSNDGNSVPPPLLNPLGDNGGDAGGWNYLPTGYFAYPITSQIWAGIGLTSPFGLKTEYDPTFIGRFQSQKAQLVTYDVNPSVAYKFNDLVSVGLGISYQHSRLTLDRSFSLVVASTAESVAVDDSAWGWNVGAMFNLTPATRLGVTYRSAISYNLEGTVNVAGVGAAGASASVKFPDTVSVALSSQLTDRWQVLADVTWTQWSTIQNVPLVLTSTSALGAAGTVADTLSLGFNNSYRIGIGANYRWTEHFTLKLGTAYDETPVPSFNQRTVFLPDNSRAWVSVGGKYQFDKHNTVDFGYAHLFMSDAGIYQNKGVAVAPGQQGIVSGVYNSKVDIVSAQYSYSF